MAGAATEPYVERIAQMWEAAGDFARAIWIRSQAQEIAVVFDRGEAWPEVWGA